MDSTKDNCESNIQDEELEDYTEILKRMRIDLSSTVGLDDIMETVYEKQPALIDGLLFTGIYILAGAPKAGKSFLMEQIAYHVSTGKPFWGLAVQPGTVLYLALEDSMENIQERMYRMFGPEGSEKLRFASWSCSINSGLTDRLASFLKKYEDTRLIIIDTFQRIRDADNGSYSYSADYQTIQTLRTFIAPYKLCLLLVHHTRKQPSNQCFELISGTNGLMGACDGAYLLQKEHYAAQKATLHMSVRNSAPQTFCLTRNLTTLCWELEKIQENLPKPPPNEILEAVAQMVTAEAPEWQGSPAELAAVLQPDISPNALTRHLNVNISRLREEYGIIYNNQAKHAGRRITLRYAPPTQKTQAESN